MISLTVMRPKISVVIITKNEERRIRDCLDSVKGWADEIIVVDDESTDKTREIAALYTDKIFIRKMHNEGEHRNWAYEKAENGWILSLDADERLTLPLKKEIDNILSRKHEFDAFAIPRKNFIGNYWIKGAGLYPSAQLKLFRKDRFKWEEVEVHPRALLKGKCGVLNEPMLHYTYRDFEDFLHKLNRQTSWEAKKWFNIYKVNPSKADYKMNFFHMLWRVLDRFIRSFFVKKGYKDGFIGFVVSSFSSLYQFVSYIKYWELKHGWEK